METSVPMQTSPPTSTSPHRRANKPLVEKRRRERINTCLDQMKGLVLEAMQKDVGEYSKMEKADILEMTVKYIQAIRRQEMTKAANTNPATVARYRAGFNECATAVSGYLRSSPGLQPEVKARVLDHLAGCVQQVSTYSQVSEQQQRHAQMQQHHQQQQLHHQRLPQHPVAMAPLHVQIPASTSSTSLPGHSTESAFTRTGSSNLLTIRDIPNVHTSRGYTSRSHTVSSASSPSSSSSSSSSSDVTSISTCSSSRMAAIIKPEIESRDYFKCVDSYNKMVDYSSSRMNSTSTSRQVECARARKVWRPW